MKLTNYDFYRLVACINRESAIWLHEGVLRSPSQNAILSDDAKSRFCAKIRELLGDIEGTTTSPPDGEAWHQIATQPPAGTKIDVWAVSAAGYGMRWPNVTWGPNNQCWLGAPLTKEDQVRWSATHWRPLPAPPESAAPGSFHEPASPSQEADRG